MSRDRLGIAVGLAFAFAPANGLHDASHAIATLVATRAARPLQAVLLAPAFNMLRPLLVDAAVATSSPASSPELTRSS